MRYLAVMETTLEQLVEQAMSLPCESRAKLADLLVQRLDAGAFGLIDRLWAAEAKRRRDEIRGGQVETVQGDEALRRVRESVRLCTLAASPATGRAGQPNGDR